jgi:hypothetical protein
MLRPVKSLLHGCLLKDRISSPSRGTSFSIHITSTCIHLITWCSTKKIEYAEENFGASDLKLTSEEVAEIRALCEAADLPGERGTAGMMKLFGQDSPPLE